MKHKAYCKDTRHEGTAHDRILKQKSENKKKQAEEVVKFLSWKWLYGNIDDTEMTCLLQDDNSHKIWRRSTSAVYQEQK